MRKLLSALCVVMSSGYINQASATFNTNQCDIKTPYNIFVTEHADANGGGYIYHKVKEVIILSEPNIPVTNFEDHEWLNVKSKTKWNKYSKSLVPVEEMIGMSGDGWTRPLVKTGKETTCIIFEGNDKFREIKILETR